MRKESWSVVLACALGALVGGLCAREIQLRFVLGSYLWIFGAFFGGAVAWCVVDFKQFCSGVARSYRVSAENITSAYRGAVEWRWEPDKVYWKATVAMMSGLIACASSLGLLSVVSASVADYYIAGQRGIAQYIFFVTLFILVAIIMGILLLVTLLMPLILLEQERKGDGTLDGEIEDGKFLLKFCNPVVLPFLASYAFYCFIRYLWENRKSIARFTGVLYRESSRFFVRAFVYVHSERRTLCFVDATLGAIAGFFLGSAITGALIGAVLGGINYEIVSVKWLKLVPTRAR